MCVCVCVCACSMYKYNVTCIVCIHECCVCRLFHVHDMYVCMYFIVCTLRMSYTSV